MKLGKLFNPSPKRGGTGTGDVNYTRTQGITTPLGGLASGYVPNGTVQKLLDDMLYPYQAPSFSSFIITGQTNPLEIGQAIPSGDQTFTWGTAQAGNIAPNSIAIRDTVTNALLASNLPNTGSAIVALPSAVVRSVPGQSYTWGIEASNTQGGAFSRSYQHLWRSRLITGTIPATDLAAFLSAAGSGITLPLTGYNIAIRANTLASSRTGSDTYNCSGNRHIFFLWDTALGAGTFTSGGFAAVFNLATVSVTNAFGVVRTYNLYTSLNSFNGSAVAITVN